MKNIVVRKVVGKIVVRLSMLLIIILLLAIGLFTFFSSSSYTLGSDKISSKQIENTFEINEWSHWLLYYDEVLTQSARNYVYTEDVAWKIRYDKTLVDLNKLIVLILSKTTNKDLLLFTEFEKVNTKLANLEMNSFQEMYHHQQHKAIAILDSKLYAKYKIQYQKLIQNYLKVKTLNYKNSFNNFKNNALYVINYNNKRTSVISDTFFIILVLFVIFSSLLVWLVIKRIQTITRFVDQLIVGDDFSSFESRKNNELDEYVESIIETLKSTKHTTDNHFRQEMSIQIETLRNEYKRNLHDRLGVLVSATKLHFYFLKPEDQQHKLKKHYTTCLKLIDQTYNEIKLLSNSNTQDNSDSLLIDRINALISFFTSSQKITIQLEYTIDENSLSSSQKECIELVTREAINNSVSHANATKLSIHLFREQHQLFLLITDDGKGFEMETLQRRNGIHYMEQRVKQLQGTFSIETASGKGTCIRVVI